MTRYTRQSNLGCGEHSVDNCAGVSIANDRDRSKTTHQAQVNHSSRTLRSWSDDASWLIYLEVVNMDSKGRSVIPRTYVNSLPSELIEVSTAL